MLQNSRTVQLVLLGFFITVAGYNMLSIFITFLLSSIWHAILDNFRPISVWGADLALYYLITKKSLGEPWTVFSWVELGGMFVLFFGTAVYNGSIRLCCFKYDRDSAAEGQSAGEDDFLQTSVGQPDNMFSPKIRAPVDLASPSLIRSPLINSSNVAARRMAAAQRTRSLTSQVNGGSPSAPLVIKTGATFVIPPGNGV
eukprot:g314.t1